MADVKCRRCGETRAGLDTAPYNDAMGRQIHDSVCMVCWEACKGAQVMVINEHRLDLSDPRAHEELENLTREFLGLDPD